MRYDFSMRYKPQKVLAVNCAGTELSSRIPASPITSPGPIRPDSKGSPCRVSVTVTTPDSMMNK
ncbi:hypothetical protein D3C76_1732650 [compost metagenome]